MSVTGRLEEVRGFFARGWAAFEADLARRATVEIMEGGKVIARGVAAELHPQLARQRFGDGRYRFTIRLPASVFDGEPRVLRARDAASGAAIPGELVVARVAPAQGQIEGISAHVLFGWVVAKASIESPLVEVRVDTRSVGNMPAGLKRTDIVDHYRLGAAFGFSFDLSPFVSEHIDHLISVIDLASGKEINGSPLLLHANPAWGVLDTVGGTELAGWAVLTRSSGSGAVVEVIVDGKVVGEVLADRERPDLQRIGAVLHCGFSCALPPALLDGGPHILTLRVKGTSSVLRGTPRTTRFFPKYSIDGVTSRRITGWIANVDSPASPIRMDVWLNGRRLNSVLANVPSKAATSAFKGTKGPVAAGFRIALPKASSHRNSQVIRLTLPDSDTPLIGRDIVMTKGPRRVTYREVLIPAEPDESTAVDVVVPIFEPSEYVLPCIHRLLNAPGSAPFGLVVIDDAVLDHGVFGALRQLADHAGFTLIRHPRSVGFGPTLNAATSLHRGRDVMLLKPRARLIPDAVSAFRDQAQARRKRAGVWSDVPGVLDVAYIKRAVLDDTNGLMLSAASCDLKEFVERSSALGWNHGTFRHGCPRPGGPSAKAAQANMRTKKEAFEPGSGPTPSRRRP